jgi:hypothetical protein
VLVEGFCEQQYGETRMRIVTSATAVGEPGSTTLALKTARRMQKLFHTLAIVVAVMVAAGGNGVAADSGGLSGQEWSDAQVAKLLMQCYRQKDEQKLTALTFDDYMKGLPPRCVHLSAVMLCYLHRCSAVVSSETQKSTHTEQHTQPQALGLATEGVPSLLVLLLLFAGTGCSSKLYCTTPTTVAVLQGYVLLLATCPATVLTATPAACPVVGLLVVLLLTPGVC